MGVQRQVARPLPARVSAVPEILGFVGWLGVICAAGLLAYFTIPSSYALSPLSSSPSPVSCCAWLCRSCFGSSLATKVEYTLQPAHFAPSRRYLDCPHEDVR
jgi:hypothetical protein